MKKVILWVIAFLITISTAYYQRITGPTYPFSGKLTLDSTTIKYSLDTSHETGVDCEFEIEAQNEKIQGYVLYRRFKTNENWTKRHLKRRDGSLIGSLPHQPPAGKLEYKVYLETQDEEVSLSGKESIIIRFKGAVPASILLAHVIFIFAAMLVSARAGIEALDRKSNPRKYALWAAGLLLVGGMILGPVVQKYAFGALWTGFPLGFDLTDNKTVIAMVGWIVAVIAGRGGRPARGWVLGASILMFVIFLIPHSLLGSELDYSNMNNLPPNT